MILFTPSPTEGGWRSVLPMLKATTKLLLAIKQLHFGWWTRLILLLIDVFFYNSWHAYSFFFSFFVYFLYLILCLFSVFGSMLEVNILISISIFSSFLQKTKISGITSISHVFYRLYCQVCLIFWDCFRICMTSWLWTDHQPLL